MLKEDRPIQILVTVLNGWTKGYKIVSSQKNFTQCTEFVNYIDQFLFDEQVWRKFLLLSFVTLAQIQA